MSKDPWAPNQSSASSHVQRNRFSTGLVSGLDVSLMFVSSHKLHAVHRSWNRAFPYLEQDESYKNTLSRRQKLNATGTG